MCRRWEISVPHVQVNFTLYLYEDLVSKTQTSANVSDLAPAAPLTDMDAFCLACTHVFYASASVGGSAEESMSTVLHLGRIEN